jgi:hypothetical protein
VAVDRLECEIRCLCFTLVVVVMVIFRLRHCCRLEPFSETCVYLIILFFCLANKGRAGATVVASQSDSGSFWQRQNGQKRQLIAIRKSSSSLAFFLPLCATREFIFVVSVSS